MNQRTGALSVATPQAVDPAAAPLGTDSASPRTLFRLPADLWLAALILLMFGLLQNGWWSAGGDSEVYLDMARNLALHRGYLFNHQPVSQVTPLWPLVLAGAMKICTAFWFLKLIPMVCMTAGLMLWYRILLRIVTPGVAFCAVLITGMLAPVETLSYRFYTEGFFTLVAAAAVLLALQINHGRREPWRIALLLLLSVAVIATRWAGLLFWPLIGGALLNRRSVFSVAAVREHARLWMICFATLLVTLIAFFSLRAALRVKPEQVDPRYDSQLAIHYDFINEEQTLGDYADRVTSGWQWIGDLICLPATSAGKLTKEGVCLAVSVLLLALVVYIPSLFKHRQWLFVSLLIYWFVLCLDWPRPVARYLVPAAPLMLVLLYQACMWVANLYAPWSQYLRQTVIVGVVMVALCNLIFAAVEIYVARAPDYYRIFEAGLNEAFIDELYYTHTQDVQDAQIAINPVNVSQKNSGQYRNRYMRAAVVLTDRGIRMIPEDISGSRDSSGAVSMLDPVGAPILQWCQQEHIRYYMYRPPASSFWHFPIGPVKDMEWRLFEVTADGFKQIKPPHIPDWPKRMPGMDR